jgi:uncharacterized cupredoxin-like copper-binding protein
MNVLTKIMAAVVSSVFLLSPVAFAGGNLAKQKPIEVRLDMGKDDVGDHEFYPEKLTFETGKLYKLVLHNPSDSKHYFTSPDFVSRIYTRKVQVMDDLGAGAKQIGEIKGAVSEVEVYPGGTVEWWFVPVATGSATVWCHIEDKDGKTHRDKGMEGMITIL